jgi:type II secretory pathway predicted ATPase ExeA
MELSAKCKEYWGFGPFKTPFGKHIEADDGVFLWPEFEGVVRRLVRAIDNRQFLVVAGAACSSKSTAWHEARRRLAEKEVSVHIAEPRGLGPRDYNEQTIYRILKHALAPSTVLKRSTEDRALQCRQLLETMNDQGRPVCLAVNDAHHCRLEFLLMLKRLWDDLYGFDRLLSVILVGQPGILAEIAASREISERTDVVRMPGLGDHLEPYLHHECRRAGATEFPFDAGATEQLARLRSANWHETLDHPLIVNNVVSRALVLAHRVKADVVGRDVVAEAMREERAMGDTAEADEGKANGQPVGRRKA